MLSCIVILNLFEQAQDGGICAPSRLPTRTFKTKEKGAKVALRAPNLCQKAKITSSELRSKHQQQVPKRQQQAQPKLLQLLLPTKQQEQAQRPCKPRERIRQQQRRRERSCASMYSLTASGPHTARTRRPIWTARKAYLSSRLHAPNNRLHRSMQAIVAILPLI